MILRGAAAAAVLVIVLVSPRAAHADRICTTVSAGPVAQEVCVPAP